LIPFARYEVIEVEGRMDRGGARPLQAMESRLQMLRRLTMNQRVPLAPLVQITSHLNDVQLEQCVNNAIRNALYR
jgi:hypothetical protein